MHPHADAVHQPPGRGSDAAKAEDTADPAREHAILRELIELAKGAKLDLSAFRARGWLTEAPPESPNCPPNA